MWTLADVCARAHAAGLPFRVARVGFLERVGIEFDHGVERRTGVVDRGDAVEIGLRECMAAEFATAHARRQVTDAGFGESEVGRNGGFRLGRLYGSSQALDPFAGAQRHDHGNGQCSGAHGAAAVDSAQDRHCVSP